MMLDSNKSAQALVLLVLFHMKALSIDHGTKKRCIPPLWSLTSYFPI